MVVAGRMGRRQCIGWGEYGQGSQRTTRNRSGCVLRRIMQSIGQHCLIEVTKFENCESDREYTGSSGMQL